MPEAAEKEELEIIETEDEAQEVETQEAGTEVEAEEAEPSKEEVSNVGRSSKPSKDDIVKSIIKACQYSGIDLLDIAEALMEIDTVSEAEEAETKVAA